MSRFMNLNIEFFHECRLACFIHHVHALVDCISTGTCRHFKNKIGQHQNKRDETRWRLLVNKVVSAKHATSAFSLAAMSAKLEQVG